MKNQMNVETVPTETVSADETLKVRINRVRVSTKIKGGPPGEGICCGRVTMVSQ